MQTATRETLKLFENRLLVVERSISLDLSFAEFFDLTLKAAQAVDEIQSCTVWLYTHGTAERVISTADADVAPVLPTGTDTSDRRVITECEGRNTTGQRWCCRTFEEVSRSFVVCLEIRTQSDPADNFLLGEATLALSECLASWFRRSLIARIDEKLSAQSTATEFCHKVYPRLNDTDVGPMIASEVRTLLKVDRVCLLSIETSKIRITGISGSDRFDLGLETPQALHHLAEALLEVDSPELSDWILLQDCSGILPRLSSDFVSVLRDGGTSRVRLLRIQPVAGERSQSGLEWALVAEMFADSSGPGVSHWNAARDQIVRVLSTTGPGCRSSFFRWSRFRKLTVVLIAVCVLAVICMTPVDFEIDASGRMAAVSARRFFAQGGGIIQNLTVRHESAVTVGQELLRIHSPELVLKIQEVLGQLETEKVRLSSLQRTRLSDSTGALARDGVDLALGGEQAVRQRISDLEARLQLLKTQQSRLVLTTDVPGTVYRRNLELDLNARPVQQGDFLFDLIPKDSKWHLELDVREELLQYLPRASVAMSSPSSESKIPVRFRFLAAPDIPHEASILRFEEAVVHRNGQSTCLAIAEISPESLPRTLRHRQPGATLTARISCGRRAAVFVMFREFVEFIREKSFLWM